MIFRNGSVFVGAALSVFLLSSQAQAHWCNDLWGSAYNIVVRPESDTVTVPSSGSASLSVFVQNNMGYALSSFQLVADIGGTAVAATRQTQKVNGTLLPGEKAKYTLTITKSGGGAVAATDINFSIHFGNSGQDNMYGSAAASGAKAAMIKKTDGSLFPTTATGLGQGSSMTQGTQLLNAAVADFGDTNSGLDKLLQLYCAGRASWNTGSAAVTKSNCSDTSSTVCPTTTPTSGNGSKYDYMHLWAAGELAGRKSGLGARTSVLRSRLQCGVNDANNGFAGFALMMLGYLGEDAGARTFIEGKISAGSDIGTIGKAALLLMGNAADMTKYKADVQAGLKASSTFVVAACAAALGITAKDDATVSGTLIPLAKWVEPDTSDNGQAIYSAQLLNLVAWDRRVWAAKAGDTGAVTFYGETSTGAGGSTSSGGAIGAGGVTSVGGATGAGGASGNKDASVVSDARTATGGALASGGATGAGGAIVPGGAGGSATNAGGAIGVGGTSGSAPSAGGASSGGGTKVAAGGSLGSGGGTGAGGAQGSAGSSAGGGDATSGSSCNLVATHAKGAPALYVLFLAGIAWIAGRRRRR